jgi:transcriptional regulator with XRE-family HTH domain
LLDEPRPGAPRRISDAHVEQMVTQLGVKKLSVARYESGRPPRVDVLDRIARHAGVSLNWLLHGSDTDRPKCACLRISAIVTTQIGAS